MKKPLPVKIVEALGWVYVALAVLSLLPMSKVMRLESSLYRRSLPIAMLIGMVVALRRGRRTLFLLANTVILLLILLGMVGDRPRGTIVKGLFAGCWGLVWLISARLLRYNIPQI